MFKNLWNWVKVVTVKTAYVVSHPSVVWKERLEEARAREMAKELVEVLKKYETSK